MATTTFTATTLTTPYYASKARYATDAAVQGARWRNSSSQQMVGFVGIPSLANVSWGGKIIDSASLTVTTRSLTQYDTIRLYGSNYNTYAYSTQKYGYEYVYTAGGYTDIALGTSATGEHTVTLTASNISWLLNTLRDGKTAFAMYYDGDTATSSQTYSEHSYGCTAFALSITYSDAKSTIDSVTDSEVGSATTLTWTNYATTGRTCKVRFTLGSADSGEITASGSSYSYTLPSSWYNELSTSTSGTATAYLYTYINGTLIGTETETFTASVPSSVVPTIGSISATKYNSNETVATWDIWLQNYTQAVIAVSGCTAGTGATIASYSFSGQNLTSTVTTTEASASATSSAIQVSGDLTYTVKITDSRGRTATSTVSVTVLAYAAPNISTAVATRCDSDGTVNTVTGVYGKARFKYTYTSIGSNAVTTRISYKLASASTYTTVQENIASWTWSSVFGTLDIASAYDVQGYIVDSLGNSSTYVTQISTVSGIAFGLKNDRARFGGAVQKAGLQVDWDSQFDGDVEVKGDLTVNTKPVVLTVNSTSPDENGNVDVSGGSGNTKSCSASLSSAGWYRIVNADFNSSSIAQGSSGMVVELHIVREGLSSSAESHDIIYRSINGGSGSFSGERSKSGTQYIDKVRYTYDADGHIDLHYTGSASNKVTVYFNVYINPSDQSAVTDGSLEAVADAPNGETISTTYTLQATTGNIALYSKSMNNIYYDSTYVSNHNIRVEVYGRYAIVSGWIILSSVPSQNVKLIYGLPDAQNDQNLFYWDQNSSVMGALYLSTRDSVWCINTGGYSQQGRTGHYLNLAGTYVVREQFATII